MKYSVFTGLYAEYSVCEWVCVKYKEACARLYGVVYARMTPSANRNAEAGDVHPGLRHLLWPLRFRLTFRDSGSPTGWPKSL